MIHRIRAPFTTQAALAAGRGTAWAFGPALLVAAAVAAARADEPPRAFVPGEISVGEPIVLPSGPAAATAAEPTPAALAAVPGNGWLGLAVAESRTPGRWTVAEVVPDSPAAAAGIRVGDDVRAINGTILRSAEDVAQSLTGIAPGQAVSVAIARDEAVTDLRMTAVPRPAPQPVSQWQAPPDLPAQTAAPQPESVVVPQVMPDRFPRQAPAPAALPVPPAPEMASAAPVLPSAVAEEPAANFGPAESPFPDPPTAGPPPAAFQPASPAPPARGRTALGVRTVPIDAGLQSRFRLQAPEGAYVIGVVQDLPAAKAGLPPGSVIVALDQRPVHSPAELTRMVTSGPVGRPVALEYVMPGGEARKAEVVLQSLELPLEQALADPEPVGGAGEPAALPGPAARPSRYRSDRPVDAGGVEAAREEIRRLRSRIDAVERMLERRSDRRF